MTDYHRPYRGDLRSPPSSTPDPAVHHANGYFSSSTSPPLQCLLLPRRSQDRRFPRRWRRRPADRDLHDGSSAAPAASSGTHAGAATAARVERRAPWRSKRGRRQEERRGRGQHVVPQ
ncbi:hypothetical protein PR202_ga04385 [Eleusine coracana subsp. coracana]|uniref:Uncharacterized protein n=1 Tax=Eleusine coracana subsp. coracana TaxID=191504 RepID=A0AAV5BPJ4_ELECO|nr:hypothetical protein PR202_ga04385 [Eleusine coracana subsp. coracana]